MKPQLDKIRAEAEFDTLERNTFDFDRGRQRENARLTPIIEKLLRVIECQGDALEFYTKRAAYELKDSFHLSAHHDSDMMADCGDKARMARAEVLRILEGS